MNKKARIELLTYLAGAGYSRNDEASAEDSQMTAEWFCPECQHRGLEATIYTHRLTGDTVGVARCPVCGGGEEY